jgi:5'-3' exonuclease
MGVRGLSKLIAPCGKLVSYDEYTGQYIAVDAFHRIYKCCSMKNMCDPNYKHAYIRSILSCITHLTQFGIAPIFVFDGMSLYFKTKYKESQKKHYDVKSDSNIESVNSEVIPSEVDASKSQMYEEKPVFKITPQQIKECEELINMLGLPCIRAPHEADSQCAAMTLLKCKNPVSVVLTDDTDALVFGAKAILKMLPMKMVNLLRDIFNEFVVKIETSQTQKYSIITILKYLDKTYLIRKISQEIDVYEEYDILTIKNFCDRTIVHFAVRITLDDVLKFLDTNAQKIRQIRNMTHNDFINLCLLLGTDYSHRIYNSSVEKIFALFVDNDYDISKIIGFCTESNFVGFSRDSPRRLCAKNLQLCDVKDTPNCHETSEKSEIRGTSSAYYDMPEGHSEIHQKINTVRDYYECASVIDPNRIDMTIYKPNFEVFQKFLEYLGMDRIFIMNIVRKYNRNILRMVR